MEKLPLEIIRNIIAFSNIIDLKRQFGIYYKIKLNKFDIINNIIRSSENMMYIITTFNPPSVKYNMEYNLPNLENIKSRKIQNIDDDKINIEIIYNQKTNSINYILEIFRLVKKPYLDFNNPLDIYYKGSLSNNYYWDIKKIEFSKS
tara:strand:+ start:728 stop:1168 length:441 start_codon:yes stop_codon:yes gene_type:complete